MRESIYFGFERALALAEDDGAVALKILEAIDRRSVFLAKSVIEFVADRSKNARHREVLKYSTAL